MDTFYYELWSEDGSEFHREFTIVAENLDEADKLALAEKEPNESLTLAGFSRPRIGDKIPEYQLKGYDA
jgi:hypothetical protein